MKAVLVQEHGGPEGLVYREVENPVQKPNQVVIDTRYTSVNFADIKARRGGYRGQTPPFIPGLDASGIVESVGSEVDGILPGQRVAAYTTGGSYAEKVLADSVYCFPLPESVSFQEGAGIGIFITAFNALQLAGGLREGDDVLVHAAAGGVGSSAVQIARALGAGRVLATVGSEAKRRAIAHLGVDHVIDYREEDFVASVQQVSGGRGVDVILDGIAGETSERGMECLAEFGRLAIYGHTKGDSGTFTSKQLHASNRGVIGYSSGGYRKGHPQVIRRGAEAVLDLLASGKLTLLTGHEFPLERASEAHALVESRESIGKILLRPR
jgi:NADPH2:quinone reductase